MQLLLLRFKRVLVLTTILVLFVGILDYTDVSFRSDKARKILIEKLEIVTGRNVSIDGDVYITVSLSPKLLVEQIHIRNINGFDTEDFITVTEARVEVSLLPLLSGIFHLEEISADQARINLIKKKDGSHNWLFSLAKEPSKIKAKEPKSALKKQRRINRLTLGVFSLTDVSILYKDESRNQIIKKYFEHILIDVTNPAKPLAEISGSVQGLPYKFDFESDPIQTLTSGQTWLLHGSGVIDDSNTNIEANIQLIKNAINGNIDINAKKINLGLLIEKLGFIEGQDATADEIDIRTKLRGSNFTELYEQAEIELQLLRGYWKLTSPETGQEKELSFNKISSITSWNKPVKLHLDGTIAGEAITLDFKTNRLLEFFDEVQKLDVDLKSNISGTEISLKGILDLPIKTKQFQLDISLKGKDLENLTPILDAEFPPFNDFSLTGKLLANKKGFILKSTEASIGDSHFQASIDINTVSPKDLWTINLSSRQLQLKDFAFDISDLQQTDIITSETAKQTIDYISSLKPVRRLIGTIQAPKIHFNLNLKVDKVLSGEDVLGKARFQLHLRDNVVSLKNANIEIPAGRITASATFKLVDNEITGNAELDINKFDYGIAARIFSPDTKMDGIISTRVNLEFIGNDFMNLLDHATGQIDFVLWPKKAKPEKIFDLWATNLYLILLPELNKKESKVNCLVGLLNMKDGKMKEEFFAIDTTKLWIQGDFNVDFENEHVELVLFPRSKTARLFSLQTPIRVAGKFSDIEMVFNPVDILGSYLSFITSPFHVPARWMFDSSPPTDGSAICEQFFDRNYVKSLNEKLRKEEQAEIDEMLNFDD